MSNESGLKSKAASLRQIAALLRESPPADRRAEFYQPLAEALELIADDLDPLATQLDSAIVAARELTGESSPIKAVLDTAWSRRILAEHERRKKEEA